MSGTSSDRAFDLMLRARHIRLRPATLIRMAALALGLALSLFGDETGRRAGHALLLVILLRDAWRAARAPAQSAAALGISPRAARVLGIAGVFLFTAALVLALSQFVTE